jgi:hypothetical protein
MVAKGKNSHGRTGNRTRDLMISSQKLWPLDHEAGHKQTVKYKKNEQCNAHKKNSNTQ